MNPGEILKYKDKGRTGLANIGNTCYINSCLQCLSHTHELNKILDDPTYKTLLNNNSDLQVVWYSDFRTTDKLTRIGIRVTLSPEFHSWHILPAP